jgi:hypothetical protein
VFQPIEEEVALPVHLIRHAVSHEVHKASQEKTVPIAALKKEVVDGKEGSQQLIGMKNTG